MPSIQKRGNSYRIGVSLGFDSNGKRIQKTITYHPKAKSPKAIEKEVHKYALQFENECINGGHPTGENITFKNYATQWLNDYAKTHLTPRQQEEYKKELERRVYPVIGNIKLAKVTALNCQKIFNQMETEKKAPSTIHRTKAIMSSVFSYAYKLGIINENPCTRCIVPPIQKKNDIHCFTLEQAKTFLQALNYEYPITYSTHTSHNAITGNLQTISEYTQYKTIPLQFKAYFMLALMSGMRKSEEIALTWNDIDFDTCTVKITKATSRTDEIGQFEKDTKTTAGHRNIAVPQQCIDVLKMWYQEEKNLSATLGKAWKGKQGSNFNNSFVFIQQNGQQMHLDTPLHKFHKIITSFNELVDKKAKETNDSKEKEFILSKKLPLIRLHDLRHTTATLLLSENTDIEVVAKRLGHANASVTLDIYGHALQEKDITASNKLEIMFK